MIGQASREVDTAGVVALAEEEPNEVDSVDGGATRLRRLGVTVGGGPVLGDEVAEVGEGRHRGQGSFRPRFTWTGAAAAPSAGTVRLP